MKIIAWNCLGAYRKKRTFIEEYEADLYIISEAEEYDWSEEFSVRNYQYIKPEGYQKGLLVYSKNHEVVQKDMGDIELNMNLFLPITCNGQDFIAIWTKEYPAADILTYCQVYKKQLKGTILIGDFNVNGKVGVERADFFTRGFGALQKWFDDNKYVSCYHKITGDEFGHEKQHTYWKGQFKNHLDYCYIPEELPNVKSHKFKFLVDEVDQAIKSNELSADHYPIILELDIEIV